MSSCKACGAEIEWLVNENTKKRQPIDVGSDPVGNVLVIRPGFFAVIYKGQLPSIDFERRTSSHFQTCPNVSGPRN